LWKQVEAAAGRPWFLGDRSSALDLYVAVMTNWQPGRKWFAAKCPRLHAIAVATERRPELAEVWRSNFPS
jgi:GST-like protein